MKLKPILWMLSMITLIFSLSLSAQAVPYQNYTYDSDGEPNAEPQAYIPSEILSGVSVGTAAFKGPKDLAVDDDDRLYVADTGNNRIIVLDNSYQLMAVLDSFEYQGQTGTFNGPEGIFISEEGELYIADTGNGRIVVLDKDYQALTILGTPEGDLGYKYDPIGVAADFAKRVYVLSRNCNEGILQFDKNGEFLGYFGAITTMPNLLTQFWKWIATDAQRESMARTVPTEYSAIDINAQGFVYGTVSAIDSKQFSTDMFIRRLNPLGQDRLARKGFHPPMGDVKFEADWQTGEMDISRLNDICIQKDGLYAVLDANKGRVFTYNRNGNLLFVFGAMGTERGQFGSPSALDMYSDGTYCVLDEKYNEIVIFTPTVYADLIRKAYTASYNRDYETAEEAWYQALKYTSKSDLIFDEIGTLYVEDGNYKAAMEYLKLANDRKYYSEAFGYLREAFLSRYFGWGVGGIVVLIIGITVVKTLIKWRKKHGTKNTSRL